MIYTEIREYHEGLPVVIIPTTSDRWVITAMNECGNNWVDIDLIDVVDWVKHNKPELLGR